MDTITITRVPGEGATYEAKVEAGTYSNTASISAKGRDPVDALKNLLLELNNVERRYEQIPQNHLTHEGRKMLELAIETKKGLLLDNIIKNQEVLG